jgi:hypothetical protein
VSTALAAALAAAQVVFWAERVEVEQQGKEAMVGTVARQVAMTAAAVAAVKTRSVAMLLPGLLVLVAQEKQATSGARLPATLAAAVAAAKVLVVQVVTVVVEPVAAVAVKTAWRGLPIRAVVAVVLAVFPVLAALAALAS